MSQKTVQIVPSQPRKAERLPLLPQPSGGLRRALWTPVLLLAGATFLLGAAIAIVGWALITVSNCCMEWLDEVRA